MAIDWGLLPNAILMLMVWSFAFFGENYAFRFTEHTFMGAFTAYTFVSLTQTLLNTGITPATTKGDILALTSVLIGVLILTKFYKRAEWIARMPMAILVGIATGLSVRGYLVDQFITQVMGMLVPLNSINNVITLILTVGVLTYFIFSFKHEVRGYYQITRLGRLALMCAFGGMYATTTMSRIDSMQSALIIFLYDFLGLKP